MCKLINNLQFFKKTFTVREWNLYNPARAPNKNTTKIKTKIMNKKKIVVAKNN